MCGMDEQEVWNGGWSSLHQGQLQPREQGRLHNLSLQTKLVGYVISHKVDKTLRSFCCSIRYAVDRKNCAPLQLIFTGSSKADNKVLVFGKKFIIRVVNMQSQKLEKQITLNSN